MKRVTKIEGNNDSKKKLRVAAYCRVSTASEEQRISLAAQKVHYENYIKANQEWELAGLYYDEGISGTKKENRDGLLSLIADCGKGKIDFIMTKSISRFCRNTTDCLELVRKLLEWNVCIEFEKENLNTGTMESEWMLSILSSLAESESVSISENEKWSIQKKFQNGTYIISYPPYGYKNVEGEMVIVLEQAEVVKGIFADTLAGKSPHAMAKELAEKGVPTKRGGTWTSGTILAILRNEKYTGDVMFQKTYTDSRFNRHINYGEQNQYLMQGHHEPIVSHEMFHQANEVVKQRGREKGNGTDTGKYQNRYGFSGRIQCGECGGKWKRRIHYKPSGSYVAWCCSQHIAAKQSCSMKYMTDEAVKAAFLTMMNKLIFAQQTVLRPLQKSLKGLDDKDRVLKIQDYERRLEKNREQRQVLTSLMAGGYLEPALFNKESNVLTREAEMLKQEKGNLIHAVKGNKARVDALEKLLRFTAKKKRVTEFDEEVFRAYVDKSVVLSRSEILFELKCGLNLKERLVD
ncbi:recombinase family protein [Anaeromicropila populeti]|uniref:Site-specific DNA recombinase n=1 Tax=Anaeromicropila populeti TaxID=37658 RepID=A0A1I6LVE2_9FIRM|nr:recombinase family protein [Anaeromicropila populeti]SFS07388.1 Site-specific DNA recombinase [Anaeromicropila populeti]